MTFVSDESLEQFEPQEGSEQSAEGQIVGTPHWYAVQVASGCEKACQG